jgi:hypothetical protein
VVLLLGIYPKECKAGYSKDLYTDVQLWTIHNNQALEITQMPYYWWMVHEIVVHIHNVVLLSHKE